MHRTRIVVAALILLGAPMLGAQQRDSVERARTRADSIAKAVRDSIALMRELGAGLADTTRPPVASPSSGPTNARLLPDISAVGDFVADLSPKGSTQEDGARFGVREVEVALQAVVDPYFRGDIFLGFSDLEGVAIEQAYLTTTSLPYQLEARLGRFLMPFGKQNTTHRHDLHTIEYPYVIQRFLGEEGLKGTGVYGSRVFSPFGFYQELQVTAVDRLSEPDSSLVTEEPVNKSLAGLGFSARLRNYADISEAQNVELSFSAMTGKRAQSLAPFANQYFRVNAAVARQTTLGTDLTYRWRPLEQGLYRSFILQGEVMWQLNEERPELPTPYCDPVVFTCVLPVNIYAGPTRDYAGAYLFARYQTSRRAFIGARYDWLQDPDTDARTLRAGSVYLEWFPSEFSKLVAGYEGVKAQDDAILNRLILQAVFSLGPHKPHPF